MLEQMMLELKKIQKNRFNAMDTNHFSDVKG